MKDKTTYSKFDELCLKMAAEDLTSAVHEKALLARSPSRKVQDTFRASRAKSLRPLVKS